MGVLFGLGCSLSSLRFLTARPRACGLLECLPQLRHLLEEFDTALEIPRDIRNLVAAGFATNDLESQRLQFGVMPLQEEVLFPRVLLADQWPVAPAQANRVGKIPRRLRGARSEEHTSELQSPCNLVC